MKKDKFRFEFCYDKKLFELELNLPVQEPVQELAHRIIKSHNLPSHAYKRLCRALSSFKTEDQVNEHDEYDDESIDNFVGDIDEIVEKCEALYEMKYRKYGKVEPITNESIFSDVYHSLIHSHFITTLLNLEHEYAIVLSSFLKQRDDNISRVEQQCRQEMEEAVKNVGTIFTDNHVNQLAKKHIEISEMESSRWSSALETLKDKQRKEYRDQVMKLYELLLIEKSSDNNSFMDGATKSTVGPSGYYPSLLAPTPSLSNIPSGEQVNSRREDCFTVNLGQYQVCDPKEEKMIYTFLSQMGNCPQCGQFQDISKSKTYPGAQMKTSHNLRLLSCDVLDLCRLPLSEAFTGQRLQTAISLYSNKLCGLVLLVDNRLNSNTGIKKAFSRVCQQTTDFHFPDLSEQLEGVSTSLDVGAETRAEISTQTTTAPRLNVGDLYVTRHSNLSEVHVIFHVVIDDSLHGDISSRHPVILAYRNVIKTAFNNDIKTITLPLLLVHEMTEDMTIAWCLRRAELVFKCIKGFIMEMSVCHFEESFNVQFLIPETLSDEAFNNFSSMMPSIFRMSNPVVATS